MRVIRVVDSALWDEFEQRCSFAGIKPPRRPARLSGAGQNQQLTRVQEQEILARQKARMRELGLTGAPAEPEVVAARLAEQGVQTEIVDPLKQSLKGGPHG